MNGLLGCHFLLLLMIIHFFLFLAWFGHNLILKIWITVKTLERHPHKL